MTVHLEKPGLTERDIENWLYENPGVFGFDGWIGRQIDLPSGIADLVGYVDEGSYYSIITVELKNRPIKPEDIAQVMRYSSDIEKVFGASFFCQKFLVGVFGTRNLDNQVLYAAQAGEIDIYNLKVSFNIEACGPFGWTEEGKKSHNEAIEKLSETVDIKEFVKQAKESTLNYNKLAIEEMEKNEKAEDGG